MAELRFCSIWPLQTSGTYTPGMTSRGTRKAPIWLIVVLSVIAVAVAAGAIVAGVIESGKQTRVRAASTASPRPSSFATVYPVRPTVTTEPAPAPVPTTTAATARTTETEPPPLASAPDIPTLIEASTPAVDPCPVGVVAGGLTNISLTSAPEYGIDYVAISGRGVIHNATDAPATFFDGDIPDVQGLNARGETHVLMTRGTFDYLPPAGQPRPSTLTLAPGESMGYSVKSDRESKSTVVGVQHFYSAMDRYDIYYSNWSNHRDCGNPVRQELPGGQSLPNTYVNAG